MIIYEGLKHSFINSVENDTLIKEVKSNYINKLHRNPSKSEEKSWEESLLRMYVVMNDPEIPNDAGIAVEYNIPQTAKRVDFMISGFDEEHQPGVVIVELKQWEKLKKVESTDAIVETYTGNAMRKVVHPSYQAWSYAQLLNDYNSTVQSKNIKLSPCAYLHNYTRTDNDPIDDKQYSIYLKQAPAFTKMQKNDFKKYIKKYIKSGDNSDNLLLIEHGKIRPSKRLQDSISSMISGNKEFVMLDDQKVVCEEIIKLSLQCQKDNKKRTIICKGGPGTGKSVIAVQVLAELIQNDQYAQYVTKNMAPRIVYENKLKGDIKLSGVENLFRNSSSYHGVGKNQVHTLIVDEAHRLEKRSQYTKVVTGDENQIYDIIHASICSVFFIDESQRVTTSDIGSIDEIKRWAKKEKSEIFEYELSSQFRCNGSDGYISWLDNLLEIRETANYNLDGIDYDFAVCDSPEELRQRIIEKNKGTNKSRILAGYCWNWPKSNRSDSNFHDIKIGNFEISWNLDNGEAFALSETSINEAGCIHTTQGLEFDYVGVIIGEDLRYSEGKVVTDFTKRASTDQSLKGIKKMYKENPEKALAIADEIIKNTYRTLMTRGMKGCYIYCVDEELSKHIKKQLDLPKYNHQYNIKTEQFTFDKAAESTKGYNK